MRQLRKLIFINSANIPYGEVYLDGNVHFIGTQGVGKSTLLRAILFFYNADIRKLGIPPEKLSFLEYYFENLNAHLVYEVQSDKNVYCVWAFKAQNRVCYRLIDHQYQKDFFIENNQSKTEKEVQKTLNQLGISYTTKRIDKYETYRDIIYGNSTREFKKYAILESNAYQNIPRTISNVFLNSKLEAAFIKNTIINSITEDKDKVSIELNNTRKNVASFQKSYNEIHVFKKHKKQGENIINSYHELLNHQKTLKKTAQQLGIALHNAKSRINELLKIQQAENNIKQQLEDSLRQLNQQYNIESQGFKDRIAILRDKIKNAIAKVSYYQKGNIENILKLHDQKSNLKIELETARKEQQILTDKHRSIEERYQQLLRQNEQTKQQFENLHDKKINVLVSQFNDKKSDLEKRQQEEIDLLNNNSQQAIEIITQELVSANKVVAQTTFELKDIRRTTFRQVELTTITKSIQDLRQTLGSLENDLKNVQREKSTYEKSANQTLEVLERKFEKQQDEIQKQINQAEIDLGNTLQYIEQYETTLYGFLDNEVEFDWRENIGKVFREDVLLNTDLTPLFKKGENSFFGLSINLDKLSVSAKTFNDFIHQRNSLKEQLQDWKVNLLQLSENLTEELNKLKQKHNTKLRQFKKETDRLSARQNIDSQKFKELDFDKINLVDKSKTEKEAAIEFQKEQVRISKQEVVKIEAKRFQINQNIEQQKTKIKQKYQVEFDDLKTAFEAKKATLAQEFKIQEEQLKAEANKLNSDRQVELKNEGANIDRLSIVENRIKTLNNQLDTIENNMSFVNEYYKDKRELIDKQAVFEQELVERERELSNITNQFHEQSKRLKNDTNRIVQTIETVQKERNNLESEFNNFEESFKISGLYKTLKNEIEQDSKIKSTKESINRLIGKLRAIDEEINSTTNLLEQRISKFADYFELDNDLDLNIRFEQKVDFIDFAERLEEVIDNDLITTKETETQKYFGQLLSNIASETSALNSLRSEIETVITKINQDFRSGNFVDAVQKIELRTKESDNKVVRRLLAIQKFKEANQNISYEGLFSILNQPTNAKKAIDLLQNLAEEIKQTKATTIHLEHSFELEFRVQENNNDTNWVERISNVGSNGTDVLVKAMVYIMLLNVFKNRASRKVKDFTIHCIIDEVGILHDSNLKGLLRFANERNIFLINGSPNPNDVSVYKHTYQLIKNKERQTEIRHLLKMNI